MTDAWLLATFGALTGAVLTVAVVWWEGRPRRCADEVEAWLKHREESNSP